MKRLIASAAALLIFTPVMAQEFHNHQTIDNKQENKDTRVQMDDVPKDPHAGHAMPAADSSVPKGVAPPIPTDHAAQAFYPAATMARARAAMIAESGGMTFSQLMLDRLEYRAHKGANGYAWEGEGWIGGDINRLAFKTEGEGEVGGPLESAELQALYSRALNPWFNVEAGVRQDFRPSPQRTYAVVGIEGLAPYWFEVGAQAFLSTKGDAHLRLEGSYDQRITQRLILQPRLEIDASASDIPELEIGSGLSSIEAGLRLRYEFRKEFAPYVGIEWSRAFGDTADYIEARGGETDDTRFVVGLKAWF